MTSFQQLRTSLSRRANLFIMGGEWALSQPEEARRNLRHYWFDGLFAAASDTVPLNYLALYLLALGATGAQVGWFSALTSLAAALSLLPGAYLVERFGRPKQIAVIFGGLGARILLLALALLPLGASGQALIWALILISVVRSVAGNLAFPAWMAVTGAIVPVEGRGRYFGSRNLVMGIASMILTYLLGEFITFAGSPLGYQLALGLSLVTGLISTWFFAQISDPHEKPETPVATQGDMTFSLRGLVGDLRASPVFLALCLSAALWNFALNIAGPFFNVYMAKDLGFTAAMIGLTSVATTVSRLFTQPKMGELADRWGPARVQMIFMFLIPILPFLWMFITQLWQVVALNLLGGILWGAFELASFNFLLMLTPAAQRARYSAIYQVIVMIALSGGAAFGGFI
ncbi:MAG: MFS transporter, partial [Anaerolineales bacterium]